jgi:hypothetical protein
MGYGGELSWIPHLKTSKGQPFVGSNPTPSASGRTRSLRSSPYDLPVTTGSGRPSLQSLFGGTLWLLEPWTALAREVDSVIKRVVLLLMVLLVSLAAFAGLIQPSFSPSDPVLADQKMAHALLLLFSSLGLVLLRPRR